MWRVFPRKVEALLRSLPHGRVVFDADGTLWRGDVGEDFLRWLAHDGVVARDAYSHYESRLEVDPIRAYAFAVEVMAGLEETRVISLAKSFFSARYSGRIFPLIRALVGRLLREGFEVWICSASPVWAVRPGAEALGVDQSKVIGVACEVVDGRLTTAVCQPVSAGTGKVAWLQRSFDAPPVLALGNGDLDLPMLAWSDRAVAVAMPHGPDNELIREALARAWAILRL